MLTFWPTEPDFDESGEPVPGTGITTVDQYGDLFDALTGSGVDGTPSDNTFKVTADSTGMNVKVNIQGSAPALAVIRGVAVSMDSQTTLTIPAADSTARVDRVVLRSVPASKTVTLEVKKGTPGSGAPAVTWGAGTYEISLATVAVGASVVTIAAGNVTDDRQFIPQGISIGPTSKRPASPAIPSLRYNTTTGKFEWWTGTGWKNLGVESADITDATTVGRSVITAADVTAALHTLGIYVQSTDPGPVAGRIWIKTP